MKALIVLFVSLFVVACGKTVVVNQTDGSSVEMPAEEYRAQQAEDFMLEYQRGIGQLLQPCNADSMAQSEYKDCVHNNQLVLVQVPYMMREAQSVNAGYWNLAAKKEDRPFRIANTALNAVQTLGYMGMLPWGTGLGSGGNTTKIVARDEGSINNVDMTNGAKSPFVAGNESMVATDKSAVSSDEAMAATDDGQNLEGQGNSQAQVQSDPIPGTNFGDATAGEEGTGGPQNFVPNSSTGVEGAL